MIMMTITIMTIMMLTRGTYILCTASVAMLYLEHSHSMNTGVSDVHPLQITVTTQITARLVHDSLAC